MNFRYTELAVTLQPETSLRMDLLTGPAHEMLMSDLGCGPTNCGATGDCGPTNCGATNDCGPTNCGATNDCGPTNCGATGGDGGDGGDGGGD